MEFLPAKLDDLDALTRLERQYYLEDGYPFAENEARTAIARLIEDPSLGRIWLAWDGQTPVGYVVLALGYSLEYRGRDAFIDEIYFLPSHRGRGLGAKGLALAEAACRELGVRALHLEVERDKEAAQALYRKQGFVDHERYLMTKRLDREGD